MNCPKNWIWRRQLDELGVDIIEAGFAIASPERFQKAWKLSPVL
jgi:isopropylmalate/homocitrate/citramalate synthase